MNLNNTSQTKSISDFTEKLNQLDVLIISLDCKIKKLLSYCSYEQLSFEIQTLKEL